MSCWEFNIRTCYIEATGVARTQANCVALQLSEDYGSTSRYIEAMAAQAEFISRLEPNGHKEHTRKALKCLSVSSNFTQRVPKQRLHACEQCSVIRNRKDLSSARHQQILPVGA